MNFSEGTRCRNDVERTSMRLNDVALTTVRRHFDVMCRLVSNVFILATLQFEEKVKQIPVCLEVLLNV